MKQETFSIYFDLEEGHAAGLATAAHTSLALIETLKEIAYVLDPSCEITIELIDGNASSLALNTIIKFGKSKVVRKTTIYSIILTCMTWLGHKSLDFSFDKVADYVYEEIMHSKDDPESGMNELSDAEINEIVRRVLAAVEGRVGKKQSERLYREVEKDKAVKGLGATTKPGKRPKSVVPREDFRNRAGLINPSTKAERRARTDTTTVILISPVLVEGRRRWRFRSREGEFGAPIRDTEFISRVLSGDLPILMKSNVELTLEIETIEEKVGNVWVPVERNVLKIIGVPRQTGEDQLGLFVDNERDNGG